MNIINRLSIAITMMVGLAVMPTAYSIAGEGEEGSGCFKGKMAEHMRDNTQTFTKNLGVDCPKGSGEQNSRACYTAPEGLEIVSGQTWFTVSAEADADRTRVDGKMLVRGKKARPGYETPSAVCVNLHCAGHGVITDRGTVYLHGTMAGQIKPRLTEELALELASQC